MADPMFFDLDKVEMRLELDRDRITGFTAAAELMRNHADDAERSALAAAGQRRMFVAMVLERCLPEQRGAIESLFAEYGVDPESHSSEPGG